MPSTTNDSHCHFFSSRFLELLAADGRSGDAIAATLGWDPPGTTQDLADRWVAELDRGQVARAALIASIPGDEGSVADAVARHPNRFVGCFMHNPAAPSAEAQLARSLSALKLRVVCLFPAMHGYRFDDERVERVFAAAAGHGAVVFAHCGMLTVGVRKKLGLQSRFDLRLGDPLSLARVALGFPNVPVIIPHFGAGFLREALMAADQCSTIHLDSSSSNGWTKFHPGLSLDDVFWQALSVAGPDRLLFGTDSSFFPRGWQRPVYDAQQLIVEKLGIGADDRDQIFGQNFDRLFPRL
jgi:predicted TIM-barrel fold metal-dependent hydrolase